MVTPNIIFLLGISHFQRLLKTQHKYEPHNPYISLNIKSVLFKGVGSMWSSICCMDPRKNKQLLLFYIHVSLAGWVFFNGEGTCFLRGKN